MQSPKQSHESIPDPPKKLRWYDLILLPFPLLLGEAFILLAFGLPASSSWGWVVLILGIAAIISTSLLAAFRVSRESELVFAVIYPTEVVVSLTIYILLFQHFTGWH